MAKLHKIEMYILDANDYYGSVEEIISRASYGSNASFNPFNIETVELEWDDDIDINYSDCTVDDYRNYFNKNK